MIRHLSLGARGQEVLAVQQGLNLRREPEDEALIEDGIFDHARRHRFSSVFQV